jgi:transcriptional regulator with XRE-family HTH domain
MQSHDMDKIGSRIKALREEMGISQGELAERVGCTQQTISAIEKGETKRPRLLDEIAEALGITKDELTGRRPIAHPSGSSAITISAQALKLAEMIGDRFLARNKIKLNYMERSELIEMIRLELEEAARRDKSRK